MRFIYIYDFFTGHASFISENRVPAFATRNKYCRKCANGHSSTDHDCRKNSSGSAKAMKPDIAVEICTRNANFSNEDVIVDNLIVDDDSSTIFAVRG